MGLVKVQQAQFHFSRWGPIFIPCFHTITVRILKSNLDGQMGLLIARLQNPNIPVYVCCLLYAEHTGVTQLKISRQRQVLQKDGHRHTNYKYIIYQQGGHDTGANIVQHMQQHVLLQFNHIKAASGVRRDVAKNLQRAACIGDTKLCLVSSLTQYGSYTSVMETILLEILY